MSAQRCPSRASHQWPSFPNCNIELIEGCNVSVIDSSSESSSDTDSSMDNGSYSNKINYVIIIGCYFW